MVADIRVNQQDVGENIEQRKGYDLLMIWFLWLLMDGREVLSIPSSWDLKNEGVLLMGGISLLRNV